MNVFTINEENAITVYADRKHVPPITEGVEYIFATDGQFEKLVATFPLSRLVEIWNGIPGLTPVKKFENRQKATTRIWKAIQSLQPAEIIEDLVEEPEPEQAIIAVETKEGPAKKERVPRENTAKARVIEMLKRGVTADAIMAETGWQKHTVRWFIAGAVKVKMGLNVETSKNDDNVTVYRVVA